LNKGPHHNQQQTMCKRNPATGLKLLCPPWDNNNNNIFFLSFSLCLLHLVISGFFLGGLGWSLNDNHP
jgi:hypothetical protein